MISIVNMNFEFCKLIWALFFQACHVKSFKIKSLIKNVYFPPHTFLTKKLRLSKIRKLPRVTQLGRERRWNLNPILSD